MKIGDKVKVTKAEHILGDNKVGVYRGKMEGGHKVEISGKNEKPVIVWAEKVEPIK